MDAVVYYQLLPGRDRAKKGEEREWASARPQSSNQDTQTNSLSNRHNNVNALWEDPAHCTWQLLSHVLPSLMGLSQSKMSRLLLFFKHTRHGRSSGSRFYLSFSSVSRFCSSFDRSSCSRSCRALSHSVYLYSAGFFFHTSVVPSLKHTDICFPFSHQSVQKFKGALPPVSHRYWAHYFRPSVSRWKCRYLVEERERKYVRTFRLGEHKVWVQFPAKNRSNIFHLVLAAICVQKLEKLLLQRKQAGHVFRFFIAARALVST